MSKVIKQKLGIEDIHSNTTNKEIEQTRGTKTVIITSIDASTIPYSGVYGELGFVSIKDKLDELLARIEELEG
ncbi:MAG: hypothetical protein RBT33_00780 [Candidatus Dojkabacteria bacterium]|jgi:hypothetical protein|nr:hypothetical protein [Candidatus Dojkabacteria bacterium]